MPRKSSKLKNSESSKSSEPLSTKSEILPRPEGGIVTESVISENGIQNPRKRRGKAVTLPPNDKEDNHETDQPAKKSKLIPFYEADFSNLFEEFILNKSLTELIRLIADIFLYFIRDDPEIIDERILLKIIEYIAVRYHENFYHSFVHATHVVINVAHYLIHIQTENQPHFTTLEKIATIYSALIHDVDHFGVTNVELIQQKHKYATLYLDQSVAEMNSAAIGLDLLNKKGYDLLQHWNEDDRVKFRHIVIELVLSTDIADQYKKRIAYLRFQDSFVPSSSSAAASSSESGSVYQIASESGRLAFLMIALRAADVSSSMQSPITFRIWAKNFFDEITEAALKGNGVPPDLDTYCRNQISYMEGHAKPLIERLISANVLNEQFTSKVLGNINANIEDWVANGKKLFADWDDAHSTSMPISPTSAAGTNHAKNNIKGKKSSAKSDSIFTGPVASNGKEKSR